MTTDQLKRLADGALRIVSFSDLYADQCECRGRAYFGIATQSGPDGVKEAIRAGRVYCYECAVSSLDKLEAQADEN